MKTGLSNRRMLYVHALIGAGFALMFSACFVSQPMVTAAAQSRRLASSMPHTGSMLQSCVPCHLANVPVGIVSQLNHAAAVVANQPANCVTCHVQGAGATWKGATFNHQNLPDANGNVAPLKTCYVCHSPDVPAAIVSRFDHKLVDVSTDGACSTCHTSTASSFAGGAYHRYTKSASMPNNPFAAPTTCVSCHTGDRPVGSVGNPAFDHANGGTGDCISCHSNPGVSWVGGTFAHTPKPTTCLACHTGQRPIGPVGTTPKFDHAVGGLGDCVFCHAAVPSVATPNATFAGGQFSHSPMPATCSSCHSTERPVGLVPVNPPAGVTPFDHANGGAGDCVSCHTAVAANVGVTWAGGAYSHNPKPTTCVACHLSKLPSPTTLVPPGGKIDLYLHAANFKGTADCATCHLTVAANLGVAWAGGNYDHLDNTGAKVNTCIACHTGNRPTTVVNGFDHSTSGTGDCVSCHTNAGVAWSGAAGYVHIVNGKLVPTSCTSCHTANLPAAATLLPAGKTTDLFQHTATFGGTSDCITCHTGTLANVGVTWAGGTYNHKNASGAAITTCIPCHTKQLPTGAVGSPNPFNHANFSSADCASCHTNAGVAWSGGNYSHNPAPATCIACHSADMPSSTTKTPATATNDTFYHVSPFVSGSGTAMTPDCVTCHASANGKTTWAGGTFNHKTSAGASLATCLPCHTAQRPTAVVSGFNHSTSGTGDCVSCHTNAGVSWTGGTFSHTPTPTTCIACHTAQRPSGTVPNTSDGFNHLYGSDCVSCHKVTIGTSWAGGKYNHTPAPATKTCQPCHNTRQHNQGQECASCHTTYGSWNAN